MSLFSCAEPIIQMNKILCSSSFALGLAHEKSYVRVNNEIAVQSRHVFFCLLFCSAEEAKKGRRVCCPHDYHTYSMHYWRHFKPWFTR